MYIFSIFCDMKVYCMFSLESPHRDDSNEYTKYTIFYIKKKSPKIICIYGIFSKGLKNEFEIAVVKMCSNERVKNSCDKNVLGPLKFYCMLYIFTHIY